MKVISFERTIELATSTVTRSGWRNSTAAAHTDRVALSKTALGVRHFIASYQDW